MRENAKFRRTVIGVFILQMCFVWPALALDPQGRSYLRTDFTVEEGLPDNVVNSIVQTRNGFLWVGTDGGLARFDGKHFTQIRLRPGISSEGPVNFLLAAADGALWVGSDSGLVHIPSTAVDSFDPSLVTMYHPGAGRSDRGCVHVRGARGRAGSAGDRARDREDAPADHRGWVRLQ